MAVVGYAPCGHGNFPTPESPGVSLLAEIAERHGLTPRQITLNFLNRHPNIFTIPVTSRPKPAGDNSASVGWQPTGKEIAAIDRAFPLPDHDVPLETITLV